ncbi:hypothetical protein [Rhizobium leguminosarum]|uniref:hypothetical protein n=1 Tax=Rhizobium leguminosarum TaxID=384 RepID=UPI002E12F570|nr:hypothetical protein U8Q02_37155 [Rhizobium leguminosarum]
MSDELDETSRKSRNRKLLAFMIVSAAIFFVLGQKPVFQRIVGEWPASVAQFFNANFLPYVIVCLVISVLSVAIAAMRFRNSVVPVTIAATVLSLSGPVAAGKVARDAQVRQVMIDEAALRSAQILTLHGLKGDDLRMDGRAILRAVFVDTFGEAAMTRSSIFNPTPDEIARRAAQSNKR